MLASETIADQGHRRIDDLDQCTFPRLVELGHFVLPCKNIENSFIVFHIPQPALGVKNWVPAMRRR